MLVIEHYMPLITTVYDEIIALEMGAVVTRGEPDEVLSDPRVVSAYLGGDIDVIHRSGESKAAAAGKTNGRGAEKPKRSKPLRAKERD